MTRAITLVAACVVAALAALALYPQLPGLARVIVLACGAALLVLLGLCARVLQAERVERDRRAAAVLRATRRGYRAQVRDATRLTDSLTGGRGGDLR